MYHAPSPIIKVSNKIVYVVVVDLLKNSTPCEDRDCWRRCGNMVSLIICRNVRGTAVSDDGIGEAHKQDIINFWSVVQAVVNEVYHV